MSFFALRFGAVPFDARANYRACPGMKLLTIWTHRCVRTGSKRARWIISAAGQYAFASDSTLNSSCSTLRDGMSRTGIEPVSPP